MPWSRTCRACPGHRPPRSSSNGRVPAKRVGFLHASSKQHMSKMTSVAPLRCNSFCNGAQLHNRLDAGFSMTKTTLACRAIRSNRTRARAQASTSAVLPGAGFDCDHQVHGGASSKAHTCPQRIQRNNSPKTRGLRTSKCSPFATSMGTVARSPRSRQAAVDRAHPLKTSRMARGRCRRCGPSGGDDRDGTSKPGGSSHHGSQGRQGKSNPGGAATRSNFSTAGTAGRKDGGIREASPGSLPVRAPIPPLRWEQQSVSWHPVPRARVSRRTLRSTVVSSGKVDGARDAASEGLRADST